MRRPAAAPGQCEAVTIAATVCLIVLTTGSAVGSAASHETRSLVGPLLIATKTESVGAEVERAKGAATIALAEQLGMSAAQIEVESIGEQTWPDSSLGCPEEGRMYLQVITPGYVLQLRAKGQVYEYHVDQSVRAVVFCQKPKSK